ncbi:helix-turn-helix domain-containing protein [Streptomyces flaveolus]|uniref:helix-turn-helix domain-containing protein n=1 Tax=Streptomyces flaveolus TaxID=67297 RepID=UPI0033DB02D9
MPDRTVERCGFNTTRAAANLYAHRNTVERRVSRANDLSAVKEDNPTHVAAAFLLLDLASDIVVTAPS